MLNISAHRLVFACSKYSVSSRMRPCEKVADLSLPYNPLSLLAVRGRRRRRRGRLRRGRRGRPARPGVTVSIRIPVCFCRIPFQLICEMYTGQYVVQVYKHILKNYLRWLDTAWTKSVRFRFPCFRRRIRNCPAMWTNAGKPAWPRRPWPR